MTKQELIEALEAFPDEAWRDDRWIKPIVLAMANQIDETIDAPGIFVATDGQTLREAFSEWQRSVYPCIVNSDFNEPVTSREWRAWQAGIAAARKQVYATKGPGNREGEST